VRKKFKWYREVLEKIPCSVDAFRINDFIYRGPRLAASDYQILKDKGFTHILNLEDDSEALKAEISAAEKVGIHVISIPMSEITRPTTKQLILAMQWIRTLLPDLLIKSGIKLPPLSISNADELRALGFASEIVWCQPNLLKCVILYVHCKHGQDRTGEVGAEERMVFENWPFWMASNEMIALGHKWWFPPYIFWRKSIIETYDELIRTYGREWPDPK
jgi:hypothetical protein